MGGGRFPQVAEGPGDDPAAILGEAAELQHGAADLLALGRREMLHDLGTLEDALTLGLGHVVELGETLAHALLHLWGEIAEAGFPFKGSLLIGQRKAAVAIHPLGEMLLVLTRSDVRDRWAASTVRCCGWLRRRIGGEAQRKERGERCRYVSSR